jgi:WD40 repeat protein
MNFADVSVICHDAQPIFFPPLPLFMRRMTKIPFPYLVSSGNDCTIRVWDITTAQNIKTLLSRRKYWNFYSKNHIIMMDENTLVASDLLSIWNIQYGQQLRKIINVTSTAIAKYSDETVIYSTGTNVCFCDINSGEIIKSLSGHSKTVRTILKLTNELIATSGDDKLIKIWDVSTCTCLKTLKGHYGKVKNLIKQNDTLMVSAGDDREIRVWNYRTRKYVRTILGHDHSITDLIKLSDQVICSSGFDNYRVWDVHTGAMINKIWCRSSLHSLARITSSIIASGDDNGVIIIWNAYSGEQLTNLTMHIGTVVSLITTFCDIEHDESPTPAVSPVVSPFLRF